MNCFHAETTCLDGSLLCLECGQELREQLIYASRDHSKRSSQDCGTVMGFLSELLESGYSKETVEKTNDIYLKITEGKIYRGTMKNALILSSLYYVVKNNVMSTETVLFEDIFKRFSKYVDKKSVMKGIKLVSIKMSKEASNVHVTARELLIIYLNKLNQHLCVSGCGLPARFMTEDSLFAQYCPTHRTEEATLTVETHINAVCEIYERIHDKNQLLGRSRPQSVASAVLYYYFKQRVETNHNAVFNVHEFTEAIGISELTVVRLSKEIERILVTFMEVQ